MQDIAVVPFLVLLPLIENGDLMEPGQSTMSLLAALGPTALQVRAPAELWAWLGSGRGCGLNVVPIRHGLRACTSCMRAHARAWHSCWLVRPCARASLLALTARARARPQTLAGLGLLLLGGRTVLRRVFAMVADARSEETFVALCLLTVVGASLMTQALGLSETMGSFVAGVLLAETNYRTQARARGADAGAGRAPPAVARCRVRGGRRPARGVAGNRSL